MSAKDSCSCCSGCVVLELFEFGFVLSVEAYETGDHDGDEDDDEPGAVGELGDGDDDVDDERQERADAVDEEPVAPVRLAEREVVLGHARPATA